MNDTVTTQAAIAPIAVNFDNKLDYQAVKFNFRSVKDTDTGVVTKRATVELAKLPVPSVEGICAILESGNEKAMSLLLEAVSDVVIARARDVINENETLTSDNFDYSLVDWNTIANLEKEDRRSAIPKEVWDDFQADYITVITSVTTSTKEQAATAAKIFGAKFAPIKTKKDVIGKLKLRLSVYMEHTTRAGDFAEIVELLFKRADVLIAAKEVNLEDSLGL
jgi:hypothetical protein